MPPNPRLKLAVAVLAALALATGALYLLLRPGGDPGTRTASPPEAPVAREAPDEEGFRPIEREGTEPAGLRGSNRSSSAEPGGLRPGLRIPTGADLSDPSVVKDLLAKVLASEPVEWDEAERLVRVLKEPLDEDVKKVLLDELRAGNRLGVLKVFAVLQDGSVTSALFAMLDDPELTEHARGAVLQALQSVPGADAEEVVRGLEARLSGVAAADTAILQAIALRGGKEATRALTDHVMRAKDPASIPSWLLQRIDFRRDPAAAEVLAQALGRSASPAVLQKLVEMAAATGVESFAEPLIALDRPDVPENVRHEVLSSLARNGTEKAVEHLLKVSAQEDAYGELATSAVGGITQATPKAREALRLALENAHRSPRPDETRKQLLTALGALREASAMPQMVEALRSTDPATRLTAVRGLGRLGSRARAHVEDLSSIYATGDDTMRLHVIVAFSEIGGEQSLGALDQIRSDARLPANTRRTAETAYLRVRQNLSPEGEAPASESPNLSGSPAAPGGTTAPR